ncbi:hypothetical protein HPB48_019930 [Haemaphysalis longicornis]|uniref:NAD(+) kinase n=1 Tax=Haemaphysalis longicornis TaxID=44386 RepID=A0A9J6FUA8_HAELO|nr:hypothetical protein HPB48_019930 [Haemaphysalis longicornis]
MKQIWKIALRRNYASNHACLSSPPLPPVKRRAAGRSSSSSSSSTVGATATARTGNLLLLAPILRSPYYPACRRVAASPSAAMHFSTSTTADSASSEPLSDQFGTAEAPVFRPRRALVLTKFSRYEFEKRRHAHLTEDELVQDCGVIYKSSLFLSLFSPPPPLFSPPIVGPWCYYCVWAKLESRGSDYNSLVHHHKIHTRNRELVVNTLRENGIETRLVDRFEYTDSNIDWADVIFTTGGDGTFLMAASKVHSRDKPIIGINSDPSRSVGYLCLPGSYTENFPLALKRLLTGKFQWMWRQRLRVTLKGEHAFDAPVELHDQQLQYPEYRFLDCWQEQHRKSATEDGLAAVPPPADAVHVLPVRSLNEVFVGESLSSRWALFCW